ncbi:MAG TPA: CinA family nicotinamide mononucleotide deamidase-related protein [Lacipirellulaceae bacterium]|nr:CinA family nicotinamide mononucleotide deamidase-related protein [Lacipirellulaceae bacterium]
MRAEIIAIGDELTTGQRLDTNSQWLAERLIECGVEVAFHTTVGDTLADNVAAFQTASRRVDVVVATGGLGPTADDLTREALAATAGVALVRDEASLQHVRQLFARRGREMPQRNAVQADFPLGATPIPNEFGTAPGIDLRLQATAGGGCAIFALPGVPAEMKPMWAAYVAPAIEALRGPARVIRHHRIKCFGLGESQVEAMLPDLIRRGREPLVGITVSDATITLRITAAGASESECKAAIGPTAAIIRGSLGSLVFGEEEDELEHVVARLLADRGLTLAVAEWATGGLVQDWLHAAAGDGSHALVAGVTVGNMPQLQRVLSATDTESAQLAEAAPHDSAVASLAAEAVRRLAQADVGLGIAAFPADTDAPDARVCVSVALADRTRRARFACATHPAIRRARTAKQALNFLRLVLLGQDAGDG